MNAPVRNQPVKAGARGFGKGDLFRLCRMLHAYLSAFAFLALMFFSATGVLLNHPEWFDGYQAKQTTAEVRLSSAELQAAKASKEPGKALAAAVAAKTHLEGAYASSDLADRDGLVHLEGPKGSSDLTVNQATGAVTAKVSHAGMAALIQDLHRGKNSGAPWRFVIDASAWLLLAMSLVGYVLFFSLRFRLKTSLILTGVSLVVMAGVVMLFVP